MRSVLRIRPQTSNFATPFESRDRETIFAELLQHGQATGPLPGLVSFVTSPLLTGCGQDQQSLGTYQHRRRLPWSSTWRARPLTCLRITEHAVRYTPRQVCCRMISRVVGRELPYLLGFQAGMFFNKETGNRPIIILSLSELYYYAQVLRASHLRGTSKVNSRRIISLSRFSAHRRRGDNRRRLSYLGKCTRDTYWRAQSVGFSHNQRQRRESTARFGNVLHSQCGPTAVPLANEGRNTAS